MKIVCLICLRAREFNKKKFLPVSIKEEMLPQKVTRTPRFHPKKGEVHVGFFCLQCYRKYQTQRAKMETQKASASA